MFLSQSLNVCEACEEVGRYSIENVTLVPLKEFHAGKRNILKDAH